jgi:hypothetical protein
VKPLPAAACALALVAVVGVYTFRERPAAQPAPPAQPEPPAVAPQPVQPDGPTRTVELVYSGERLEELRVQFRGETIESKAVARVLAPDATEYETVIPLGHDPAGDRAAGEFPRHGHRGLRHKGRRVPAEAAPGRFLHRQGKDFKAVWNVIQVSALLAMQSEDRPKPAPKEPPQAPAPKEKPIRCTCIYCSCLQPVRPGDPFPERECSCSEEKCKENDCLCNKWKKKDKPKE